MHVESEELPTHLARTAERLNVVGLGSGADSFLTVSYLFEAALKTLVIALRAGLASPAADSAYRQAHSIVRADGLGVWLASLREMTSHPTAGYLLADFSETISWLTRKRVSSEDLAWFGPLLDKIDVILGQLDAEVRPRSGKRSLINAVEDLVTIRNKTKAHGARGLDFWAAATEPYGAIVTQIAASCPLFTRQWLHLSAQTAIGRIRVVSLKGPNPRQAAAPATQDLSVDREGVYLLVGKGQRPLWVGELLRANRECWEFFVPNGDYRGDGSAEFIDYSTGRTLRQDLSAFLSPPAPLPPSETEGLACLDIQSNTIGNLPPMPPTYVGRPALETELTERLLDRNHPIITLHGKGGFGKTTLALRVSHALAASEGPVFDSIVWFSARDIDLRPGGPARVRARVTNLADICAAYATLSGDPCDPPVLAELLRHPSRNSELGTLFVFDNFETLEDPREIHEFLAVHTHLPNKVLITSRERAFKADWPIEVCGMEFAEADELIRRSARLLGAEGLITDSVIRSLFETTDGHAYVMRLLVGEMAKEKRYVPAKTLLPRRMDIVDTVFERSFNKLSEAGRWVFLIVSNWRSAITALQLLVVCAERGLDVDEGIQECLRLSLISEHSLGDGEPAYSAPHLANLFGKKKLESDPDRLALQETLRNAQAFGVLPALDAGRLGQARLVARFATWAQNEAAQATPERVEKLDGLLLRLAEYWPGAWWHVADFRSRFGRNKAATEYAYRRLVEEHPHDREAWLARAKWARATGTTDLETACLVTVVELAPTDARQVSEVAYRLCSLIDSHKFEIPRARRGTYLAGVREHMVKLAPVLDADGLSRLAWLFLLENNKDEARRYAQMGLSLSPENRHCRQLWDRLG